MFNALEDMAPPKLLFHGFYVAEVISTDDPAGVTTGRARLRVFPMMTGLSETVLPWAVPAFPLFEGAGANQGSYCVPSVGSRVWVFFAAGDVRSPVYFANAPGATDGPATREPGKSIWRSRTGHEVTISDKPGEEKVEVATAAGSKVTLDDAGSIVVVTHKDGHKVTMDASKVEVLHANGEKVNLTTANVELGKGTLLALVNSAFQTLYNAHTHAGVTTGAGVSGMPVVAMGPSQLTVDTKAS